MGYSTTAPFHGLSINGKHCQGVLDVSGARPKLTKAESANNSGNVKAKTVLQPEWSDLKANFNLAYTQAICDTLNLYIDHKWQRSEMEYFQAGPDKKIITANDIYGATIKGCSLPGTDANGKELLKMEVTWAIEEVKPRFGGEAPQMDYNVKMRDCANNNFAFEWSVGDGAACIKWEALKWDSKVKALKRGHTHAVEQHHSQLVYPTIKATFVMDGNNYETAMNFMKSQMEGKIQRIEGALIYKDPALADIFTVTFREAVLEEVTLADAKAGEDVLTYTITISPEDFDFKAGVQM